MSSFISAIISFGLLLCPLILIPVLIWAIDYSNKKSKEETLRRYHSTTYYLFTRNDYNEVIKDRGLYGEYDIFMQLRWYENYGGRFLYNIYLPKEDGSTTEIDVIFLTRKGLFVFESKNYRGWIFGREDDLYWTQTFNKNAKERFYNPIKQNDMHIKYLKKQLNMYIPIYSVIVFSNGCTLKSVPKSKQDLFIIKRQEVNSVIKNVLENTEEVISYRDIDEIQKKLFAFSQRSREEKQQHIENIKNRK